MAILLRHKNSIYQLNDTLAGIGQSISDETTARETTFGTLSNLLTTEKTTLVAGVNSLLADVGSVGDASLKKADNLSDVLDVAQSRTNLSVMEQTVFDNAVQVAKLSLGTNHTVADITARDALNTLTLDDRVLVSDIGDGTWASYKPMAIDGGTGSVTSWTMVYAESSLTNVISAADVRVTYASNANTNIFHDAEQTKVGHLGVTQTIDLGDVSLKSNLVQDLTGYVLGDEPALVASLDGIKAYIEGVASVGGLVPSMEAVVVSGDQITLEHSPINGLSGICNFATVRYTDENDVSYDAPVQATGDPKVFNIVVPTSGLWDTRTVNVQYYHFVNMVDYEEQAGDGDEVLLEGTAGIESTATDTDADGWIDQGIIT